MQASPAVSWLATHGVKGLIIFVGAALTVRAARALIGRLEQRFGYGERDLEWQRRASTLGGLLARLVTVSVWFIAALMVLRELAIDVLPILTGAGIFGLAIGFGAQNLVRDVISGFFLILEDQVRVGDLARINGVTGSIEYVNLRTIVLRDGEGAVHVFPNGTVSALANLSKQFSNAVVEVRVRYGQDLDLVFQTIHDIGAAMQADPEWAALLVGPIDPGGVESLDDRCATIRTKFKTQPLNQGKVANEMRKRIATTLAARGIRPFGRPSTSGRA